MMTELIHILRAWRPGHCPQSILRARLVICAAIIIGVSACGTTPRETPPSYGDWRSALGEPVDRVRFSHLIDWQALDREWISLEFSDRRIFALQVRDPCIADARQARSLRLDTAMSNLLHRSDRVRLDDYDCLIKSIRTLTLPTDDNRLRGSVRGSRGN